MIKVPIHQESITILNKYACNNRISKCIKYNLLELKGKIEKSTITTRNFNIPPIIINWISRKKVKYVRFEKQYRSK